MDMAGAMSETSVMMLPGADVGDHVVVDTGFIVKKLDEGDAIAPSRCLSSFRRLDLRTGHEGVAR